MIRSASWGRWPQCLRQFGTNRWHSKVVWWTLNTICRAVKLPWIFPSPIDLQWRSSSRYTDNQIIWRLYKSRWMKNMVLRIQTRYSSKLKSLLREEELSSYYGEKFANDFGSIFLSVGDLWVIYCEHFAEKWYAITDRSVLRSIPGQVFPHCLCDLMWLYGCSRTVAAVPRKTTQESI